jgi:hypothetical protein
MPRNVCLAARTPLLSVAAAGVLGLAPVSASASHLDVTRINMTFSTDVQGPTAGTTQLDAFYAAPIYGTDVLTPKLPGAPGPNPPGSTPNPGMFIENPVIRPDSPAPGLAIGRAVYAGLDQTNGWGELDALSYGRDPLDTPNPPRDWYYAFSVDEFAIGRPDTDVRREGALGAGEAAADTFVTRKPALPAPPAIGTNAYFTDGDNEAPSGAPGVGLIEPNAPSVGSGGATGQIDAGDNLDAVDFGAVLADRLGPLYFSLDSAFSDPLEVPGSAGGGSMPNYGTAAINGYVGGDVLVGVPTTTTTTAPGGTFSRYAEANQLGLDLIGSADSDDLDALKLHENGQAGYQPSQVPFDWLTGDTDMLLFSVRRGSALIGLLDSIFGLPIEEGDVLTTPCATGVSIPGTAITCVGEDTAVGVTLPGIFTAAEQLGLATVRSGVFATYGVTNLAYGADKWADDLDALDQVVPAPGTLALLALGLSGAFVARRRAGRARR